MAITMRIFDEITAEKAAMDEKLMDDFFKTVAPNENRELVKATCETFTRLLLSLTPFKAKEFVEKNCVKVRQKIMREVDEKLMEKIIGGKHGDEACN